MHIMRFQNHQAKSFKVYQSLYNIFKKRKIYAIVLLKGTQNTILLLSANEKLTN